MRSGEETCERKRHGGPNAILYLKGKKIRAIIGMFRPVLPREVRKSSSEETPCSPTSATVVLSFFRNADNKLQYCPSIEEIGCFGS